MSTCGITSRFRQLSPAPGQIAHVFLTRPPREIPEGTPVRLACIRHAASVDPEPGSNSPPSVSTRHPHRRLSRRGAGLSSCLVLSPLPRHPAGCRPCGRARPVRACHASAWFSGLRHGRLPVSLLRLPHPTSARPSPVSPRPCTLLKLPSPPRPLRDTKNPHVSVGRTSTQPGRPAPWGAPARRRAPPVPHQQDVESTSAPAPCQVLPRGGMGEGQGRRPGMTASGRAVRDGRGGRKGWRPRPRDVGDVRGMRERDGRGMRGMRERDGRCARSSWGSAVEGRRRPSGVEATRLVVAARGRGDEAISIASIIYIYCVGRVFGTRSSRLPRTVPTRVPMEVPGGSGDLYRYDLPPDR